MSEYRTITRMTDSGPYIIGLILDPGCEVGKRDVDASSFHVHCVRREKNGEVLLRQEPGSPRALPSKGNVTVLGAVPCDEDGTERDRGRYVRLSLKEERLNKRIEGNLTASRYIINEYRITQLTPLPAEKSGDGEVTGLVFDTCTGDLAPELAGWDSRKQEGSRADLATLRLGYGFYTPENREKRKLPLLIWLHGAGEGGTDPLVAYTGNRVTALSGPEVQRALGGEAWVLVPQSPTVWMDDGKEILGRSNRSVYSIPLKDCIDGFIAEHEEEIDRNRIYLTGISNGGFMTVRMLLDYPGFFAAGAPGCTPFYEENVTAQVAETLKEIPLWLVHSKDDPVVPLSETARPLYRSLRAAGARNLHFTLYDEVTDPTGEYKDAAGRPKRYVGHAVWVPMLDNACRLDLDGTRVLDDGEPVTLWEWLGRQHL